MKNIIEILIIGFAYYSAFYLIELIVMLIGLTLTLAGLWGATAADTAMNYIILISFGMGSGGIIWYINEKHLAFLTKSALPVHVIYLYRLVIFHLAGLVYPVLIWLVIYCGEFSELNFELTLLVLIVIPIGRFAIHGFYDLQFMFHKSGLSLKRICANVIYGLLILSTYIAVIMLSNEIKKCEQDYIFPVLYYAIFIIYIPVNYFLLRSSKSYVR